MSPFLKQEYFMNSFYYIIILYIFISAVCHQKKETDRPGRFPSSCFLIRYPLKTRYNPLLYLKDLPAKQTGP